MLACYLICVMITNPAACISAAKEALRLCAEVVIPSLFPFFVCSNLLIGLGGARVLSRYLSRWMRPLFGIPGAGALAVVLGVVSGYPVGADCVAELYASGECTKTEAERMLAFCNNSGPLFVMGAIGVGMLNNPKLAAILGSPFIGYADGSDFPSLWEEWKADDEFAITKHRSKLRICNQHSSGRRGCIYLEGLRVCGGVCGNRRGYSFVEGQSASLCVVRDYRRNTKYHSESGIGTVSSADNFVVFGVVRRFGHDAGGRHCFSGGTVYEILSSG